METEEAVTEFVTMLRLGTAALREIVSKDAELGQELEAEVNQLIYLTDSIDEIGDSLRSKARSGHRDTSTRR